MKGWSLLVFTFLFSQELWAQSYSLPADVGILPGSCTFAANTVNCTGNLSFSKDSDITVTQGIVWNVSGNFISHKELSVNIGGSEGDLILNVEGDFNAQKNATIVARLSVDGSVLLGKDGVYTGDLIVSGNLNLAKNSQVDGNITASSMTVQKDSVINGNINVATLHIHSGTVVNGNVQASGSVQNDGTVSGYLAAKGCVANNGTVSGDVNSPCVANYGSIGGEQCSINANVGPCNPITGPDHYRIVHGGTALTCEPYQVQVLACADANCTSQIPVTANVVISESSDGFASQQTSFSNTSSADLTLAISTAGDYQLNLSVLSGDMPVSDYQCSGSNCAVRAVDTGLLFSRPDFSSDILLHRRAGETGDIGLRAVRKDNNSGACGPALQGSQNVTMQLQCLNPGQCSAGSYLHLAGQDLSAQAASVSVTFNSEGRAVIPLRYDDVGQIRLDARVQSPATGAELLGSSNAFVVRPYSIAIAVTDNPSAGLASDFHNASVFKAAGENFSVRLTALNALGDTTPNFANESPAQTLTLLGHQLVAPVPGTSGTLSGTNSFSRISSQPVFTSSSVAFSEVGTIRLQADVTGATYLGTGSAQTTSAPVGRFVPAHFALTNDSVEAACNGFSYMGQPFAVKAQILAQNANKQTTANYQGLFAKSASLTLAAYQDEDLSGRLSPGSHHLVWGAGVANLDTDITFVRPVTTPSVDGPFDALVLGLQVNDSDSVPMQAVQPVFSAAQAFAAGSPTKVRYGRAVLANAYGPETEPLPLPLQIEYYLQGTAQWQPNLLDSCTAFSAAELTLVAEEPSELLSSKTGAGTVIAGKPVLPSAGFVLSSAGLRGDVTMQWQELADWLKYDWQGSNMQEGPKAKATFGQFRGNDRLIFQREVFY